MKLPQPPLFKLRTKAYYIFPISFVIGKFSQSLLYPDAHFWTILFICFVSVSITLGIGELVMWIVSRLREQKT